jgi:DNA primase catalytic core
MKSSLIVIVLLSSNVFSSPFFFFSFVQCVIQFQACQAFVLKSSRWHCVGFNRLKSRSSYSLAVVVLSSSSKNKNDYYPAEVVQQIKDHVSIIDVIRDSGIQGLNVRDNNRRATALCPFHDDTNPSFAIVNDKHMKMYKCFGCGATGDIFTYLMQSNNNDITSFGQAVQFLLQNYCEPQLFLQNSTTTNAIITNATTRREEQHLRQRIQHANAAAALFYFQNLYKLPSAGLARQHLLELRGFTPEFIHQFRLGYAPATAPLVRHLSSLDFTPHEILQAGLAKLIIDKKNTNTTTVPLSTNLEEESHTTISTTTTTANHNVTQNDLKDRFINRLMIPIWDTDGKQVIGFGGRILQNNLVKNDSDTYNPPKYLNTQGTLIFQKRQILFGIHVASLALNTTTTTAAAAASDGPNKTHNWTSYSPPPSIIIVEGYMDALALYNVGIRNVAATMGTAISMEQLLLAVKVICNHSVPNRGTGNETPSSTTTTAVGKIILLMDQDEAGISAVERLCSTSQILQQLTTTNYSNTNTSNSTVDVMVASLPKGCKDPDEYIQHKRITLHNIESTTLKGINNINQPLDYEGSTMQQIFEHEIVQKALDWKDWYLNLLLSKHSSLANDTNVTTVTHSLLYDQVSDFISSFSNHQMQSYLAKQFVDQCANRLNEKSEKWDENSTHHVDSGTTANRTRTVAEYKIKLETDIWDMITKKLAKKERSLTQPVSSLNLRYVQRFDKSNNERRLSFIQASKCTAISVIPLHYSFFCLTFPADSLLYTTLILEAF